tara:strand:- start:272 stop:730 length:459 start_codon:yes stop_codon:yes gene_type:complete
MTEQNKTIRQLIHEFFLYYPDYQFCRTLALNIQNNVTTHEDTIEILAKKNRATLENRVEIEAQLNRRTILINKRRVLVKSLSLREIMNQEDAVLEEILKIYFKHPYAHGRTKKVRVLPRWIRTMFLSALVGHANSRGLDLDYDAYFDMLTLL